MYMKLMFTADLPHNIWRPEEEEEEGMNVEDNALKYR